MSHTSTPVNVHVTVGAHLEPSVGSCEYSDAPHIASLAPAPTGPAARLDTGTESTTAGVLSDSSAVSGPPDPAYSPLSTDRYLSQPEDEIRIHVDVEQGVVDTDDQKTHYVYNRPTILVSRRSGSGDDASIAHLTGLDLAKKDVHEHFRLINGTENPKDADAFLPWLMSTEREQYRSSFADAKTQMDAWRDQTFSILSKGALDRGFKGKVEKMTPADINAMLGWRESRSAFVNLSNVPVLISAQRSL